MTITLDDVKAGKLRDDGHMNYGPNGSGWLMQHSAIPRLTCIDRGYAGAARQAAGLPFERVWCVDGMPVASLEAAIDALNVPPVFTDEERTVLEHVPVEWVERVAFSERIAAKAGLPIGPALEGLHRKGALETAFRPGEPFATVWIRRAPGEEAGE
ncbi:hypothetical protein [Methylobacterium sp. 88A]|uniref:hypothetical protein n=1 Tax=Methylobacterium sp. 88A TaxID=1131813 RepID=UPI00036E674C|nr:hypothetical protein [Methylobacterium sp. 88A]